MDDVEISATINWIQLVKEERIELIEWLTQELKIGLLDEWYRVSWTQIIEKISMDFFIKYPLDQVLLEVYPDHKWNVSKLQAKSLGASNSSQRILGKDSSEGVILGSFCLISLLSGKCTSNPTSYPTTGQPTVHPTTKKPTRRPATKRPTTKHPTAKPTPQPTASPTVKLLTYIVNGMGGNSNIYSLNCPIIAGSQIRWNSEHGFMLGLLYSKGAEAKADFCFYAVGSGQGPHIVDSFTVTG